METAVDIATTSAVRRVLVRHWIDLGRMSVRANRGLVWIEGELSKLPNAESHLDAVAVATLFAEIKHIPSVKRVNAILVNWEENGDNWRSIPCTPPPAKPVTVNLSTNAVAFQAPPA